MSSKTRKKNKNKKKKKTQKGGGNNLHILLEIATNEIVDLLNSLNIMWFPIEGTLISVLRYGSTYGKIGNRINLTDGDIDIMVMVKNQEDWLKKINNILNILVSKKWNPIPKKENTSDSNNKNTRIDKYRIYYHTKSNLDAEIYVDIHSLIDNGKKMYTQEDDLYNNLSKWPFKRWGGSVDRSFIFPLKKAYLNNREIRIPNKSVELLLNWDDGEYENGCLLLPPAISKNNWQYKWFKDYIETNVNQTEIDDIINYSKKLDKRKLPSFIRYVNNFDKCYADYMKSSHKGQWY